MSPTAPTSAGITDFGAMSWAPCSASDRPLHPVRVEQARVRELRDVSGGHRGQEGAGAGDLHATASMDCPCSRPTARRLAWTSTRHGEQGGQIFVAAVEPRRGAGGRSQKAPPRVSAAAGAPRERHESDALRRRCCSRVACDARRRSRADDAPSCAPTSSDWPRPSSSGRLTGTEGERRAAEYLAGELRAIGASRSPGRRTS